MYSSHDLLSLLNSEKADELKLRAGKPPVLVVHDEPNVMEGPALSPEDLEQILQAMADTRQRRELRDRGVVRFIYRFQRYTTFVVCARLEAGLVEIDIC
jgi:Tfp pilus assembly ATPase PilU